MQFQPLERVGWLTWIVTSRSTTQLAFQQMHWAAPPEMLKLHAMAFLSYRMLPVRSGRVGQLPLAWD